MRQIKIDIYEFDELSEETKQKVLNDNIEINTEMGFWYDFVEDEFKNNHGLNGMLNFDLYGREYLYFSNVDLIDKEKFINGFLNSSYINNCKILERAKKSNITKSKILNCLNIEISNNNITLCTDNNNFNSIEEIENRLQSYLNNEYNILKDEIRKGYDYLISDEAITETLVSNNCEFFKNGTEYFDV